MGFNLGHFVNRIGHALQKPAKKGASVVHKTVSITGASALNTVADLKRRPLVGIGRIALSATGAGAIALGAYDIKRLRDRSRRAKTHYRAIARSALIAGNRVQRNLEFLMSPKVDVGHTHTSPINDIATGMPCGGDAQSMQACQAQPSYGFGTFGLEPETGAGASPGPPDVAIEKPPPEERGADATTGPESKTPQTTAGAGIIMFFLIGGLLLYAYKRG